MKIFAKNNCVFHMTIKISLIAILSAFMASCNYFESEQSKLNKANKLYDENMFNKAIFMSKSILQADSKNCEARILLGKAQFAKYSLIDAEDSFNKAKGQGCKDVQLLYFLVKTHLYMNQMEKVDALLKEQVFSRAANEPEGILIRGDQEFLKRDYDKADGLYKKYYSLTHDEASNCLSQVKLLAIKLNYSEVIKKSLECEKQFSNNKKYDIDQSRYLRAISQANTKQVKETVATLNDLLANYADLKDPNIKIQSSLLLMKIYLASKDVENANKMADVLLKYIATPDIYYVKGLKAEKDNRNDLAEQQFLAALKLNPNHKASLLAMANLKFKENNIEQARYYTGKADALSGKNIFSERLDELLAVKYLQAGDLDSIINKIPHNKSGESQKSQYILALAYAKKGDRAKAMSVFHNMAKEMSNVEQKELLEARLDVALGELGKAETLFNKYINSGNAYALTGLTQIYMRERKFDKAETLLRSALQKQGNKYNTTLLLVELYANSGQKQKIFDLLNTQINAEAKNTGYKIVLAKMYYKYALYDKASKLCGDLIQSNPKTLECYAIKANSQIKLGNDKQAEVVYKELLNQDPKNAYSYLMLAFLAEKHSKYDEAMKYVDKSLEINPQYVNAVYAKIEFLLKQNKSKDALEYAKTSANAFKQKQVQYLLLGFVYSKTGDTKNAYLSYKSALENGNRDIKIVMQMYKLSVSLNGEKVADEELDKFLGNDTRITDIYFVANYFMSQNNYKNAEKYYEKFVSINQNNVIVQNNLAWLKLHDGNVKDALNYANKALALAPESPAIMDTMGQILLKTGELEKAGSYLLKASQKMGDNPSVKFHLAQYYFQKNDLVKSKELLKQIENVQFDEQEAAEQLLKKINAH